MKEERFALQDCGARIHCAIEYWRSRHQNNALSSPSDLQQGLGPSATAAESVTSEGKKREAHHKCWQTVQHNVTEGGQFYTLGRSMVVLRSLSLLTHLSFKPLSIWVLDVVTLKVESDSVKHLAVLRMKEEKRLCSSENIDMAKGN